MKEYITNEGGLESIRGKIQEGKYENLYILSDFAFINEKLISQFESA